ncbi:hypothetical protein SLA2020_361710 [Shorea laevis]
MVDSFERRSEAYFKRAAESACCLTDFKTNDSTAVEPVFEEDDGKADSRQEGESQRRADTQMQSSSDECIKCNLQSNPFLPKITMVGISTTGGGGGDGRVGQMSKSTVNKTMDNLMKALEKTEQGNATDVDKIEIKVEDRDPLFVANVGDYYASFSKIGSARWVRGGNN